MDTLAKIRELALKGQLEQVHAEYEDSSKPKVESIPTPQNTPVRTAENDSRFIQKDGRLELPIEVFGSSSYVEAQNEHILSDFEAIRPIPQPILDDEEFCAREYKGIWRFLRLGR